jgi:hypothetical protein
MPAVNRFVAPSAPKLREAASFNKPAAPNPAIASRLHAGHHWRGIGEPER